MKDYIENPINESGKEQIASKWGDMYTVYDLKRFLAVIDSFLKDLWGVDYSEKDLERFIDILKHDKEKDDIKNKWGTQLTKDDFEKAIITLEEYREVKNSVINGG